LGARWCIMGNHITEAEEVIVYRAADKFSSLGFHMLGCIDSQAEMALICAKVSNVGHHKTVDNKNAPI
jgi:hypothetical protein